MKFNIIFVSITLLLACQPQKGRVIFENNCSNPIDIYEENNFSFSLTKDNPIRIQPFFVDHGVPTLNVFFVEKGIKKNFHIDLQSSKHQYNFIACPENSTTIGNKN